MGISTDQIIGNFQDREFDSRSYCLCSICSDLLEDAVVLRKCEHIFCRSCIAGWVLAKNNKKTVPCPECRTNFSPTNDMKAPPLIIRKMIGDIMLRCNFSTCGTIVGYNDLSVHKLNCLFNPDVKVSCLYCETQLIRWQVETHQDSF